MNIKKVESFDDMKEPGDYIIINTTNQDESIEERGIALKCICGDIISLSNRVHTFNSYDPLDISPSILHMRDDHGQPNCHYFIKEGKYVQA